MATETRVRYSVTYSSTDYLGVVNRHSMSYDDHAIATENARFLAEDLQTTVEVHEHVVTVFRPAQVVAA